MSTLDALLAGIVADPLEETRWLVLADWLEENDDPRRGELLRFHRNMLATCCDPDAHPERAEWQARVTELLVTGVRPCVPRHALALPGGVPLVGAFIAPGSFVRGGAFQHSENPAHRVTLTRGWYMGVFTVTQAQWGAVMGTDPSKFKGANRPVEMVSWDECQAFCDRATDHLDGRVVVRLPTEAEWGYACRAGTTTHFHFGAVPSTDLMNYNGERTFNGSLPGTQRKETTPVGAFPPNSWGLHEMHGNVWEWCADWSALLVVEDQIDPYISTRRERSYHVMRGGGCLNVPEMCRSAARCWGAPPSRASYVGFRVAFRPSE
jgi:uncharacterized protein (TIGR02996 family)